MLQNEPQKNLVLDEQQLTTVRETISHVIKYLEGQRDSHPMARDNIDHWQWIQSFFRDEVRGGRPIRDREMAGTAREVLAGTYNYAAVRVHNCSGEVVEYDHNSPKVWLTSGFEEFHSARMIVFPLLENPDSDSERRGYVYFPTTGCPAEVRYPISRKGVDFVSLAELLSESANKLRIEAVCDGREVRFFRDERILPAPEALDELVDFYILTHLPESLRVPTATTPLGEVTMSNDISGMKIIACATKEELQQRTNSFISSIKFTPAPSLETYLQGNWEKFALDIGPFALKGGASGQTYSSYFLAVSSTSEMTWEEVEKRCGEVPLTSRTIDEVKASIDLTPGEDGFIVMNFGQGLKGTKLQNWGECVAKVAAGEGGSNLLPTLSGSGGWYSVYFHIGKDESVPTSDSLPRWRTSGGQVVTRVSGSENPKMTISIQREDNLPAVTQEMRDEMSGFLNEIVTALKYSHKKNSLF